MAEDGYMQISVSRGGWTCFIVVFCVLIASTISYLLILRLGDKVKAQEKLQEREHIRELSMKLADTTRELRRSKTSSSLLTKGVKADVSTPVTEMAGPAVVADE